MRAIYGATIILIIVRAIELLFLAGIIGYKTARAETKEDDENGDVDRGGSRRSRVTTVLSTS